MRVLLVGLVAAVLGVAAAWGATRYEFRQPERAVPLRDKSTPQPKVVVEDGDTFNFGTMQLGETREHAFVLHNVGDAPLELTVGQSSCKCTVGEISGGPVPPGESRKVLISWTPPGIEERFRQRAPIHTNDPEKPVVYLKIGGSVSDFFKIDPNPVSLGQFSPAESNTYNVNVWGYLQTPWKFKSYQCLDADTARYFDLEARDMTPEEIAATPGALNGQVLKLTVKAGIPLGQVRQRFLITYNDDQAKPVELSVAGKAVGDISVFGKDFKPTGDFVDLGNVPSGAGKKSTVSLVVRGPHRDQAKLKITRVDPASSLQAQLGEPAPLAGKSVSWPLTIEIPLDAEPVNRLGSEVDRMAQIEIDTGMPESPVFVLKVRFSVTP